MMSLPPLPARMSQPVRSLIVGMGLFSALVAALGSVWLTLGMDLTACPLCLYQRACIFCVAGVLTIGLLNQERNAGMVALTGLAPAVAAVTLGAYHVYLEATGKLECPRGIAGVGSAPQQALAAEAIVVAFLLIAGSQRFFSVFLAVLMGAVLALLMVQSAPKTLQPTKAYEGRFHICRPPYIAAKPAEGQ